MEMTVAQYAKSLKISRHTVYKQINENRLPQGIAVKKYLGRTIIKKLEA